MSNKHKKVKIELTVAVSNYGHIATKVIINVDAEEWAEMDAGARDEFMEEEMKKIVQWDYRELPSDE
jgi:hypothetical protein